MRGAMVNISKALNIDQDEVELSRNDPEATALGAYLSRLFTGANPKGRGKTARQLRKGGVERTDPAICLLSVRIRR